jgi:hypothetical protein
MRAVRTVTVASRHTPRQIRTRALRIYARGAPGACAVSAITESNLPQTLSV